MQLKKLTTNFLGKDLISYDKIDSTQSEIWRLVKENKINDGTLVMADIQTAGKGTHGRTWHTDEPNNIAFSFYIDLNCDINKVDGISIEIAEIILDIFKQRYGITLEIKAPNDIMYKGKKLGGILTESKVISGKVLYLVVGIGINTHKQNFLGELENIATSIKNEFKVDIDREEFIAEFCNRFEKRIIEIRQEEI